LLLLLFVTIPATAADWPQRSDVFESGEEGYALYRIPGIIVTARGTVLAYCEARKTGKSDWDAIDILLRRSTDGGKTWGARQSLADVPGPKAKNPVAVAQKLGTADTVTYNNPVAFADNNGDVHFIFCLEYARCFYLKSKDDGLTWSKPVEITATFDKFRPEYNWQVLATGPGHGIQLKSGRLLVPVWLSLGTGGHAHRPSVTSTIYSDDHGTTWQRGEIAVPNTATWINPNETSAVELSNGSVMLNVRSESKARRRLVVTSRDGATQWSEPKFDDALLEPVCMASILRLPGESKESKAGILFSNPHANGRSNLSIKLSEDDGQTWVANKVLDPGFGAYSDLASLADGTVLCFYERGKEAAPPAKAKSYAYLSVVRFDLNWLKKQD
jgi:sialidase-1